MFYKKEEDGSWSKLTPWKVEVVSQVEVEAKIDPKPKKKRTTKLAPAPVDD